MSPRLGLKKWIKKLKQPPTVFLLVVVVVFLLCVTPLSGVYSVYYPDERHYTDGALQMLATGNWLVPHTAEGEPRLVKPPITYWLTALSFKLFGVNVFAARLSFMILCALILVLTWRLGTELSNKHEVGLLATTILAGHPQFILTASRSMPDAPLLLGITMGLLGFARIIFLGGKRSDWWLAYGGVAIAALSKGLWALVLLGWVMCYVVVKERSLWAIRKLFYWPALFVCTVVALSWFVSIKLNPESSGLESFLNDQVTGRITHSWIVSVGLLVVGVLAVVFNFLPWSLPVLESIKAGRCKSDLSVLSQDELVFLLGWAVVNVVVVALGNSASLRYYLISAPALSVVSSSILVASVQSLKFWTLQRVLYLTGWVVVVGILGLTGFYFVRMVQAGGSGLREIIFGLFTLVCIGMVWFVNASLRVWMPFRITCSILFLFSVLGMAPVVSGVQDKAVQIAGTLKRLKISPCESVLFVGKAPVASRVRVCTGGSFLIRAVKELDPTNYDKYRVVVGGIEVLRPLVDLGYRLCPAGVGVEMVTPRDWPWTRLWHPSEFFKQIIRFEQYFVAVKEQK